MVYVGWLTMRDATVRKLPRHTEPAGRRAAIYARISADREGRELGVERQGDDCAELAHRRDWEVVDTYIDNDMGASTRSRKKSRPEYQRLLSDARTGRFQVIIAYTSSRLTRRP